MAYSQDIRDTVRAAFIKGQPLKQAAALHDIPYETARSWKRKANAGGDDWDNARAAARISGSGVKALTAEVLEDFVLLFQSTLDEIKKAENIQPLQKAEAIARLSDAYQKTVKAAGASNPELSALSIAMDVIRRQADFIHDHFPQHQEVFIEILEPFGKLVSREFK